MEQVSSVVSDETKERDLVLEDEEEDFLDEGNSNVNLSFNFEILKFI